MCAPSFVLAFLTLPCLLTTNVASSSNVLASAKSTLRSTVSLSDTSRLYTIDFARSLPSRSSGTALADVSSTPSTTPASKQGGHASSLNAVTKHVHGDNFAFTEGKSVEFTANPWQVRSPAPEPFWTVDVGKWIEIFK